jgi:DNA invertase Pin-like site-specific DNA recombinase
LKEGGKMVKTPQHAALEKAYRRGEYFKKQGFKDLDALVKLPDEEIRKRMLEINEAIMDFETGEVSGFNTTLEVQRIVRGWKKP